MDSTRFYTKQEASAERRAFYDRLKTQNAAPLWEVLGDLVRTDPRTACVPTLWRYDEVRPFIMEAGALITAEEAERRVLILENPGFSGGSRVTQSLYAGLQLILPGEIAHSHRHATSALRFVLEGEGAYTAVDGERVTMKPGDFILTPSWTYHDHGNPGSDPVVWLDGLDIPDHELLRHELRRALPRQVAAGRAPRRRRAGPLRIRHAAARIQAAAAVGADGGLSVRAKPRRARTLMAKSEPPDPRHGVKMQYTNPATGGYPAADDRRVPAAAAERLRGPAVPIDRRDRVLRRRRQRLEHDRRSHVHVGQARHLRRAVLASRRAQRARGVGAVQLFRSSRTEGLGVMARRDLVVCLGRLVIALTHCARCCCDRSEARPSAATGRCTTTTSPARATRRSRRSTRATSARWRRPGRTSWARIERPARSPADPSSRRSWWRGVMYVAASDRVVALEPDTGKETWRYTLKNGAPSRRGVTYWPGDADAPAPDLRHVRAAAHRPERRDRRSSATAFGKAARSTWWRRTTRRRRCTRTC